MQGEDDSMLHFNDFSYQLISLPLPSLNFNSFTGISHVIFVLILYKKMFV